MSEIAIGTRLWRFDENRRVYSERGIRGMIIYAEHFVAGYVVGETPGKWLCASSRDADIASHPNSTIHVNKKTLREPARGGFSGAQWFTDEGRDANIWAKHHRPRIVSALERCRDADVLKKVAILLGYDETKWGDVS